MASLRPSSRLLARQFSRITSTTSQAPPSALHRPAQIITTKTTPTRSSYHTTRLLRRQEDNFGSTGRADPTIPQKTRTTPTDFPSNDAYPDGKAPGEPKDGETLSSGISAPKSYSFAEIRSIASSPDSYPHIILVDVREPSELLETGRIPGAKNVPVKSAPDAFFLSAEDFEDKYGFARPGEQDECVFYCKAGVRSNAAARLAAQAGFGGTIGEYPGSWNDWSANGGEVQKE